MGNLILEEANDIYNITAAMSGGRLRMTQYTDNFQGLQVIEKYHYCSYRK
jgi:hypothetical protein